MTQDNKYRFQVCKPVNRNASHAPGMAERHGVQASWYGYQPPPGTMSDEQYYRNVGPETGYDKPLNELAGTIGRNLGPVGQFFDRITGGPIRRQYEKSHRQLLDVERQANSYQNWLSRQTIGQPLTPNYY